jgi:hypothetical protein
MLARLFGWINEAFWRVWLLAVIIGAVVGVLVYRLLGG